MTRRDIAFQSVVFICLLALTGCLSNEYEVVLKPDGESLERSLTCWTEGVDEESEVSSFPREELVKIAAAYDAPVPEKLDEWHKFSGRFSGELPADLGGSGSYTHWESPLGTMSAYVERLRGNDDLLSVIDDRLQSVDRVVDLLSGWLEAELKGKPVAAPLRNFVDRELRHDLKNLSVYVWTMSLSDGEDTVALQESLVRAGQYLVERNYLKPKDIPIWTRAVGSGEQPELLLDLVRKILATKTGLAVDKQLPPSLGFLGDLSALNDSMNRYLRDTEEYRHMLSQWQQGDHPEGEPEPEPVDVMGDLLIEAFLPRSFFGASDKVRVKLAVEHEPFATNGQWEEESESVTWSRAMASASDEKPGVAQVMFAIWCEPNKKTQRQHFGTVALESEVLGEYCLWYAGLTKAEAEEWDTFVATLKPGSELKERVQDFRFSFEEPAGDIDEGLDLAAAARGLILSGLESRD